MDQLWRKSALALSATLVLVSASALAQSDKSEAKTAKSTKPADKVQTASGVIVKVEPMTKGDSSTKVSDPTSKDSKEQPRSVRLTINTAAVWRDWVRDQATATPKSPQQAANDGNKSIATSGQPESADTLVVVEVTPETKVETRYRSATDEISEGGKTPQDAAKAETANDPADTSHAKGTPRSNAKPPSFRAEDLKSGLFVEVTFGSDRVKDRASVIRVMRPVGGANIPAGAEKQDQK